MAMAQFNNQVEDVYGALGNAIEDDGEAEFMEQVQAPMRMQQMEMQQQQMNM